MTAPAPIIFINRGNSPHLFLACAQARRTNPQREIILLGDSSTAHFGWLLGIRHVNFSRFEKNSERLRASFVNDSTNPAEFELFCLQRWFILHDFLTEMDPNANYIHLDSDVLAYSDLSEPELDFAPYGMTFQACSGHSSFINSTSVLGEFVAFILGHYENADQRRALKTHTDSIRRKGVPWNVSDMSFFLMFHEQFPTRIVDVKFPMKGRYALDQTIDSDFGGFEMADGLKKVTWKDGMPFCRHLASGKLIRFDTLHFQGKSKRLMPGYGSPKSLRSRLGYSLNRAAHFGSRLLARMRRDR